MLIYTIVLMILTVKVKHFSNVKHLLPIALQVAKFVAKNKPYSTPAVKHFGLHSAISGQLLRKYKAAKQAKHVKLIIPGATIKDRDDGIWLQPLKILLSKENLPHYEKINQVELDDTYAYLNFTVTEPSTITPLNTIGVDCNTTSHCVVSSCQETGKVLKLGKSYSHIHTKYRNTRKKFQKKRKFSILKKLKIRESRKTRDLNHKMSRKVVNTARDLNACIVMENLTSIRKRAKVAKSFKGSLHSWSYYQFQTFVAYKAKLLGIPVYKIDPRYTSQQCSKCGLLGTRNGKEFRCSCGHVAHADVNASFVIALRHKGVLQLPADKDVDKGSIGTPKRQRRRKTATLEHIDKI